MQCIQTDIISLQAQSVQSLLLFLQPHPNPSLFFSIQNGAQYDSAEVLGLLVIRSEGHVDLCWAEPVGFQADTVFPVGPVQCVELEMSSLLI